SAWPPDADRELGLQALSPECADEHSAQVERLVPRRGSAVLGCAPRLPLSRDSGPAPSTRGRRIENRAIRYSLDTSRADQVKVVPDAQCAGPGHRGGAT